MTAPGTFSNKTSTPHGDIVHNPQQHHLVLTGANGEPVVTSENHPTPEGSKESLEVVVRTVLDGLDQVTGYSAESNFEVDVREVTDYLWGQQ